jgi:hypothetical protein
MSKIKKLISEFLLVVLRDFFTSIMLCLLFTILIAIFESSREINKEYNV